MFKIRKPKIEEARIISNLVCETINIINSRDYDDRQIEAWISKNQLNNFKEHIRNKRDIYVLDDKGVIGVGIARVEDRTIGGIYVKHDKIKQGYGSKLLDYIEKINKKKGVKRLKLYSTITAKGFYKKNGYSGSKIEYMIVRDVKIPAILMEKDLTT